MELTQATEIVVAEFEKHRLFSKGWSFVWDRAKRRFGQCIYSKKLIKMSEELTLLNNVEQFTDTLRHEIAHAIVGPGHHHNNTWKLAAISVGARAERCYGEDVIEGPAVYVGHCKDCGHEFKRHRLTRRITHGSWHTRCRFKTNRGKIEWIKNSGEKI